MSAPQQTQWAISISPFYRRQGQWLASVSASRCSHGAHCTGLPPACACGASQRMRCRRHSRRRARRASPLCSCWSCSSSTRCAVCCMFRVESCGAVDVACCMLQWCCGCCMLHAVRRVALHGLAMHHPRWLRRMASVAGSVARPGLAFWCSKAAQAWCGVCVCAFLCECGCARMRVSVPVRGRPYVCARVCVCAGEAPGCVRIRDSPHRARYAVRSTGVADGSSDRLDPAALHLGVRN